MSLFLANLKLLLYASLSTTLRVTSPTTYGSDNKEITQTASLLLLLPLMLLLRAAVVARAQSKHSKLLHRATELR